MVDGARRRGGSVADAARVLRENAQLRRAILSAGLLVSGLSTGAPLVMTELKAEVWGARMSRNSSIVYLLTGLVSIAFGSSFGKWSDTVDRRAAFALVGLLNFVPWYIILLFGTTERALLISSVATVMTGVTCMTPTGCPMMFTIANDLIPPEDREIAFGVSYSLVFVIAFSLTMGGILVMSFRPGDATAVLLYILALSIAFFAVVASLRLPASGQASLRRGSSGAFEGVACAADESPDDDAEESSDSEEPAPGGIITTFSGLASPQLSCLETLEPSQLWWMDSDVRNLCLVATLLSLPEVALADMSQQFVYSCLGLLSDGGETDAGAGAASGDGVLSSEGYRKQSVSAIFTYPGMLVALPAFFLAGIAAKRLGALTLLRIGIPVSAVLQALPALLVVFPQILVVMCSGVSLALSGVIFTPLQTVCAEIAPPGAVGESMALVGVSKQAASVAGNILVFFGVPLLQSMHWDHPLWVFYPLAAAIALSSSCFAAGIRSRPRPAPDARELSAADLDANGAVCGASSDDDSA
eukprot:TRINITY_DN23367_c0_g1_i1.p1 TRINITY_DN23367_c0_g1~~TRINITY_DN23367_c0_g1_i1.p1  ORF type:complete len:528 (-),score=97.31 TRINITY_DN23367_c0_g1_i1:93-1676(-)